MEAEQLKELLTPILTAFREEVMADVNKANAGTATSISKELKKVLSEMKQPEEKKEQQPQTEEATNERLTLKALSSQYKELEAGYKKLQSDLAAKEQEAFEGRKSKNLLELSTSLNVLKPQTFAKLFSTEYGSKIKETPQGFVIEDGEEVASLQEVMKKFLDSEEGSIFLPASNTKGASTIPAKNPTIPSKSKSLEEQFNDAFSHFRRN